MAPEGSLVLLGQQLTSSSSPQKGKGKERKKRDFKDAICGKKGHILPRCLDKDEKRDEKRNDKAKGKEDANKAEASSSGTLYTAVPRQYWGLVRYILP